LFDLHFLHQTRHSATEILSGLLNPAVQSVHLTPAAARKYADLRLLFPVLDVKLGQIEIPAARAKGTWKSYTESEIVLIY